MNWKGWDTCFKSKSYEAFGAAFDEFFRLWRQGFGSCLGAMLVRVWVVIRKVWKSELAHRAGSLVVIGSLLLGAWMTESAEMGLSMVLVLMVPLMLIWWPATISQLSGVGKGAEKIPAFWIRFSGWFFLVGVPMLMWICYGRIVFEGYFEGAGLWFSGGIGGRYAGACYGVSPFFHSSWRVRMERTFHHRGIIFVGRQGGLFEIGLREGRF